MVLHFASEKEEVKRLFAGLASVAVSAEHLAIGSNRSSAFNPRRDMVGFHLFNLEMLATDGADAVLSLIDLSFGIVVKGTNAQMVDIVVEDIPINTTFVLNIRVAH